MQPSSDNKEKLHHLFTGKEAVPTEKGRKLFNSSTPI